MPGSRTTLSLTYRHGTHTIAEGIPHNTPIGRGRDVKRNRDHQRRRWNLQRRRASHRQLEYQWHGGGALRRQRIHAGGSAANEALQGAYHVQAKAVGDDIGRL
jgi:hypothetical protein